MSSTYYHAPVDTSTFDLKGTHYEIGLKIGQGSTRFELPPWWPEPPPLAFAEACAREIASFHPTLLDEIHGHADGQQQSYPELLRLICRQRLAGRNYTGTLGPLIPEPGGCTSFAWRGPDGHLRVGRNYDFNEVQRIRQRVRLAPNGSRPTVGMRGSVPAGRCDGVNDEGLFVCFHIVLSDSPQMVRPGIPFHLIPRILLENCATLREALDMITMIPHLHSFNYLIADPTGCAVVECHADRLRIRYPEGDVIACGNFYRHPDMAPLQRRRQQHVSRQRVAYLESGAWQHPDRAPLEAVQAALRDHSMMVCGHQGGHTTLWSAAADLTTRQIGYTVGQPCCADYAAVQWPGEEAEMQEKSHNPA